MMRLGLKTALCTLLAGGWGLSVSPVRAHIDMEGVLQGRAGNQKAKPCEGKDRSAGPVYTFEPGATITVGVNETVGHDGYFRIAFDDDGEDDFKDPVSIDPVNPKRYNGKGCQGTAQDQCGQSDFCNVVSTTGGASVLWDNLDPHVTTAATRKKWSWNVTLPNVECDHCTLQVMQVMEDPPGHGPFDGQNDLYYRCINIVLKRGAGMTPGTTTAPVQNQGIECAKMAGSPGPSDAGSAEGSDAGVPGSDSDADAGVSDAGMDETDADDGADEGSASGTRSDAGSKRDASASGAGSADEEDDDDGAAAEPAPQSSEGCALTPGPRTDAGLGTVLSLALAALVVRRRRARR